MYEGVGTRQSLIHPPSQYPLVSFKMSPLSIASACSFQSEKNILPVLSATRHFLTTLPARRDSVPYAALYIAPILIDTRLHSTRGQFFIRHECGAMYTSQNEHFAYTYDIAVCIWIQYIRHHLSACILQMNACRLCTRHVFESFQIHFLFCILEG